MRDGSAWGAGLVLALSAGLVAAPEAEVVVKSVRPVVLATAASLHRNAAPLAVERGVLIGMEARSYGANLATNVTPPLVMYGTGACEVLHLSGPPLRLEALCPPLAAGDEAVVWLTLPGEFPQTMNERQTAGQLALAKRRGFAARAQVGAEEPLRFAEPKTLREWLRARKSGAADGGQ